MSSIIIGIRDLVSQTLHRRQENWPSLLQDAPEPIIDLGIKYIHVYSKVPSEFDVHVYTYARLTFEILSLDLLAAGLVLKLVILTEVAAAVGAGEDPPPVLPDPAVTLRTGDVRQRTAAGVRGEALATVTHPRLTEITNSSLM